MKEWEGFALQTNEKQGSYYYGGFGL